MEPIISKLQEGVKYPRFERDATTIINDLVEHITKERGVYSSSIEPNPNEHKVWFNTNNNTLNIYENGKWNTISGQGGGSSSGAHFFNAVLGGTTNNVSGIISGGTISGATISGGTLTGTINATNATISGGNIDINQIKAKSIETPYIRLTSGSTNKSIQLLGDNYVFNGKLADSTLFHSIDLNHGSIAGLTSIKTLSYTGLSIEPYDVTSTGTPITIHGRAAGIDIIADSTAHVNIECITKLNWIKGSSNGYMMTFNTTNNTINSNYDTFNIANGNIKLTSGLISGSANINLTLSGTISGGTISGVTISGGTINGGFITGSTTINGATISGAAISGGNIYGAYINATGAYMQSINISNGNIGGSILLTGTINGGTISGATISGGTISGGTINGGFITGSTTINGATISGAAISGGNIYGAYINATGAYMQSINISNGNIGGSILLTGTINGGTISGATISGGTISGGTIKGDINASGATINGATINNAIINGGNSLLYAGSKVLVSYTGSITEPILIPNGGAIGNDSSSLILCGVTLTGGDFTKLKNLQ